MDPKATVVITTQNRKEELRNALASVLTQDVELETIVVDDASTDGTAEMVHAEFPNVRVERSEKALGYIVQRNRAAAMARAPYIVSIDDDAVFTTPSIVSKSLSEASDSRVGAVAIPFINVNESKCIYQLAPGADDIYVAPYFIGTAHLLRKDLFLKLGAYREALHYQYEEIDYGIRMFEAGFVVRMGLADPIHHFQSPKRIREKVVFYGERNKVLVASMNFPPGNLPAAYLRILMSSVRTGMRVGYPGSIVSGLFRGFVDSVALRDQRRPISKTAFHRYQSVAQLGQRPTITQLFKIV